jgi:hypothetical protein
MVDKNHHTYTVNGRISTKEEYDTHARYMDELSIPGQKLFREKMKKGDAAADEVIDALIGIGYGYDSESPLERAKGGAVKIEDVALRGMFKSSRKKNIDGIARRGKTRAKHR